MKRQKQKMMFSLVVVLLLIMNIGASAQFNPMAEGTWHYNDRQEIAESLSTLGIFRGDGTGFALDRAPNRAEASVMFVRLLGKEDEALNGTFTHPFLDANMWAEKYIGFMYENNLTKGVSATEFAPSLTASADMYITFCLRALGYETGTDFEWAKVREFASSKGLIDEEDKEMLDSFNRGGLAVLSYRLLSTPGKYSGIPLINSLITDGSIKLDDAIDAGFSPLLKQYGWITEEGPEVETKQERTIVSEFKLHEKGFKYAENSDGTYSVDMRSYVDAPVGGYLITNSVNAVKLEVEFVYDRGSFVTLKDTTGVFGNVTSLRLTGIGPQMDGSYGDIMETLEAVRSSNKTTEEYNKLGWPIFTLNKPIHARPWSTTVPETDLITLWNEKELVGVGVMLKPPSEFSTENRNKDGILIITDIADQ